MDCDLSLHYTLSLGDDTQDGDEDDEEEYFDPFEVKPSDKKTEMNVDNVAKEEQPNTQGDEKEKENEIEHEEQIAGDDHKLDANISEDLVIEKRTETEPAEEAQEDVAIPDQDPEQLQEADEDQDVEDEEEVGDEDEDEDEDLRKEMEASWEKQEKEKNKGMLDLLQSIKNKGKHRSQSTSPQKLEKPQTIYPKLNPMVLQNRFNADFKITLNGNSKPKQRNKQATASHRAAMNLANKRKQITHLLKKKMAKKRKREMRKYRKEFGTERDYYSTHKHLIDDAFIPDEEEEEEEDEDLDAMDSDEDVDIELKLPRKQETGGDADDDDVEEEMEPEQYIANIVQDGEELDEEDIYRAALMAKPETISSELRELLDIAADEEDEHGEIVRDKGDEEAEQEEKVGIAKNLLAEKSEIQFLKQHKQIYDAKRNQIHRQLEHNETEQELELMKRAFIDGEYRKLQNKRKQQDIGAFGEDNDDGQSELKFKSRNFELDRRNEPEYYLSDNEEKNEFCCYNENGLFYDIYTIRMRIMEWNKNHNELLVALDDEEDKNDIVMRQKRVQKRETMNNLSNSNVEQDENTGNVQKLGTNDQNAIRLLQRVRNKKNRKKPKLNKANTLSALDTNFQLFYKRKGLHVDSGLQRSNSQSFLEHREKCAEVIKTNQSLSMSNAPFAASSCSMPSSNVVANKRVVVFQQHSRPQKQKRKRENPSQAEKNNMKRRRVQ